MPSVMYTSAIVDIMQADLDLELLDIRVQAVKAAYVFSAAHDFLDDVLVANRVAVSPALTTKAVIAGGIFDADDTILPLVGGVDAITGLILYAHTGVDATARLICRIDGFTAITPNGLDITITWANTGSRIFRFGP